MSLPTRECGLKFTDTMQKLAATTVTPYAGVWIEIHQAKEERLIGVVTPYAGVWIEMNSLTSKVLKILSLPTRECGLKLRQQHPSTMTVRVTPYAGVWIEIRETIEQGESEVVTPYAGVWIEIGTLIFLPMLTRSLPTRECGLKSLSQQQRLIFCRVTPYAGVWIEMEKGKSVIYCGNGHSLRGSVD